ncbi:MAG: SRPBCC family protein [Pseudomonadota bacterium]
MKLKITQDATASAQQVYAAFTDFARYEEMLRDSDVTLSRKGGWGLPEPGRGWTGKAMVRSKLRRLDATIVAMEPDRGLELECKIGGLRIEHAIALVPLGQRLTRVNAVIDLKPDTLSARLLVQSLKLARAKLLQRMQARLEREVARVEQRASPAE